MRGYVDQIDRECVRGWCEGPVEVVVDRRFVVDSERVLLRPDLAAVGLNGIGFEMDLAAVLPGYVPNEIIVRPRGRVHPLPAGYLKLDNLRPFQYVQSDVNARGHNERLLEGVVRGVCLFTSRSGGTYLSDLIRGHPRAYAFAEPVDGFSGLGRAGFYNWLSDYFLLPSRVEYPVQIENPGLMFLTSKIYKHDVDLLSVFNYYNVRYLRLYRENVIKQALSFIVARKTYAETFNFNIKDIVEEQATRKKRKILIDPYYLLHLAAQYQESENVIDDMVSAFVTGDVLSISYERLIAGEEGIRAVFNHFGLEYVETKSSHVKVNNDDLSELVENYEEVARVLRGTRYAHCL